MNYVIHILIIASGAFISYYEERYQISILGNDMSGFFIWVPIGIYFTISYSREWIISKVGVVGQVFVSMLRLMFASVSSGLWLKCIFTEYWYRDVVVNSWILQIKRINWSRESYIEKGKEYIENRQGSEFMNIEEIYKNMRPGSMKEWESVLQRILKEGEERLIQIKTTALELQIKALESKVVGPQGWLDVLWYDYVLDPRLWIIAGVMGLGYVGFQGTLIYVNNLFKTNEAVIKKVTEGQVEINNEVMSVGLKLDNKIKEMGEVQESIIVLVTKMLGKSLKELQEEGKGFEDIMLKFALNRQQSFSIAVVIATLLDIEVMDDTKRIELLTYLKENVIQLREKLSEPEIELAKDIDKFIEARKK